MIFFSFITDFQFVSWKLWFADSDINRTQYEQLLCKKKKKNREETEGSNFKYLSNFDPDNLEIMRKG